VQERFRSSLSRVTRDELEQSVKRYLYLAGFAMDFQSATFTAADRAVAVLEMRRRSLDFNDRNGLLELALQLWSELEYHKAASRVQDRIDQLIREERERKTAAAAAAAAAEAAANWHISPAEFSWPESASIVVLDLGRVQDAELRQKVLSVVRRCHGCDEVRPHPVRALAGVRITTDPAYIQSALRLSGLNLEYLWITDSRKQQYLVIKPRP
jgi:hypothetical protein